MPKFSQNERQVITQKLTSAAEKLFCEYGLKKVTIEEIAKAAAIAKGSFYAFYPSKEELYFSILVDCQKRMWQQMDVYLSEHQQLTPRALVKQTLLFMFDLMNQYPLIQRTDSETMTLLMRKLPSEVIGKHTDEDAQALQLFQHYGVRFTQPIEVVAKTFQVFYGSVVMLENKEEQIRNQVISVMIDGLVNELVEEK